MSGKTGFARSVSLVVLLAGAVAAPVPFAAPPSSIRITPAQELGKHTAAVGVSVQFSPDGGQVASAGEDGTIRIWEVKRPLASRVIAGFARIPAASLAYSPDGSLLAGSAENDRIRVVSTRSGSEEATLVDGGISVTFAPDGSLLAATNRARTAVRLWSARNWQPRATLEVGSPIEAVRFSPDGKRLATAGPDGVIRVWRVKEGSLEQELRGHLSGIRMIAYSPDGKLLASAGEDRTVNLWSTRGQRLRTLGFTPELLSTVAFSPDGRFLVAGTHRQLYFWRTEDGSPAGSLDAHSDWINALAFSPDGKLLATGSRDSTVRLWHVD